MKIGGIKSLRSSNRYFFVPATRKSFTFPFNEVFNLFSMSIPQAVMNHFSKKIKCA